MHFSTSEFDEVYFANTNSVFCLIALDSKANKKLNVFTFDDGTGNLVDKGILSKDYDFPLPAKVIYRLLGVRHTVQRAKNRVIKHYSIYPNSSRTISPPYETIRLVSMPEPAKNGRSCSVILGTVLDELLSKPQCEEIEEKLVSLSRNIDGEVYLLPHPRGKNLKHFDGKALDSDLIAEDLIAEMLTRYSSIRLYGFCSSAQVNMKGAAGIYLTYLLTNKGNSSMATLAKLTRRLADKDDEVINLDEYLPRPF